MHHGRKHSASAKLIRVNSVDSQANTENAGSGTFAARTMPAIGSLESYGPSASRPKHGTRVPSRRCSPTRSLLRVTHVRIGVLNCSLYCNPPTISIETYISMHTVALDAVAALVRGLFVAVVPATVPRQAPPPRNSVPKLPLCLVLAVGTIVR